MLRLESLSLESYLLWKQMTLSFEPGLTFVHGANFSGKSLIAKSLTNMIWGIEGAKRGTDASVWPKKASAVLAFQAGDASWELFNKGGSLRLTKNDKSLGLSGKKAGLNALRAEIAIPKDLWDSTVVLNGLRPHYLTDATKLQRADWFASVFGIDEPFDAILAQLQPRLKAAREASTKYTSLTGELANLKASRKAMHIASPEEAAEQLSQLADKIETMRVEASAIMAITPLLRQLLEPLPDKPKATQDELRDKRALLRKELDAISEHERYVEASASYRRRKAELESSIATLRPLRVRASALEHLRELLAETQQTACGELEIWRQEAKARAAAVKLKKLGAPATEKDVMACEAALDAAKKLLANLRRADAGSVCDHCGQPVTAKHRNAAVKKLTARISKLEISYAKLKKTADLSRLAASVTAHRKPDASLPVYFDTLIKQTDRALRDIEAAARLREQLTLTEKAMSAISGKKPPKPKRSRAEVQAALDEIETALERCNVYRSAVEARKRVLKELPNKYHKAPPAKTLKALEAKANSLTSKLSSAQTEHSTRTKDLTRYGVYTEQIISLSKRLKELRHLHEQVPVLQALTEAYGRSGLRLDRLKTMASAFEQLVNDSIPLLLSPKTNKTLPRFSVSVLDDGVNISFHRKGLTSDLSTLSGCEEKVWKLLSAYALIRLLPDRMRCDTMILDEMETNMRRDIRSMFARSFLPALVEAGIKVLVISPMDSSEFPVPFDRAYRVVPKSDVSTLLRV